MAVISHFSNQLQGTINLKAYHSKGRHTTKSGDQAHITIHQGFHSIKACGNIAWIVRRLNTHI